MLVLSCPGPVTRRHAPGAPYALRAGATSSHLSCANEDGLKEAVDAAHPRETRLLHEYRHALYADGEVGRFGRPKHDFLRLVIRHGLKGHLVELTSPSAGLQQAAQTRRPYAVPIVLYLDRAGRWRHAVVPHRDHAAASRPNAPKAFPEGTPNVILGKQVREGVVASKHN